MLNILNLTSTAQKMQMTNFSYEKFLNLSSVKFQNLSSAKFQQQKIVQGVSRLFALLGKCIHVLVYFESIIGQDYLHVTSGYFSKFHRSIHFTSAISGFMGFTSDVMAWQGKCILLYYKSIIGQGYLTNGQQ